MRSFSWSLLVVVCFAYDKERFIATFQKRHQLPPTGQNRWQRSLLTRQEAVAAAIERHVDEPEERNVFWRPFPTNPPTAGDPSIYDIVVNYDPPMTVLESMIDAADLEFVFDDIFFSFFILNLTLFAPTDDAFSSDTTFYTSLYEDPIWERHLLCFLSNHGIAFELPTSEFTELPIVPNIFGAPIVLGVDPFVVNSVPIIDPDLSATNGIVHVIGEAPLQYPCTSESIFAQGQGNDDFSTLISLLEAAQLAQTLDSARPLQLFAPNNDAFSALPQDVRSYLVDPENVEDLRDILRYHLLSDFPSDEFVYLDNSTDAGLYQTAHPEGFSIEVLFEVDGGVNATNFTLVGGTEDNVANVLLPFLNDNTTVLEPVLARNGVIYGIDAVLIPPLFEIPGEGATPAPSAPQESTEAPTPAPSLGSDDTAAPSLGSEDTSAPSLGSEDTTAPSLGSEDTSAPSLGSEDTSAPSPGSEETPAPSPGSDGGGNRADIQAFITSTLQLTDEETLLNEETAQNAAFEALLTTFPDLDPSSDTDQVLIAQIYSLNTIYFATTLGGFWTNQDGWLTNALYCGGDSGNWFGVTCSDDQVSVSELLLPTNGLSGFIPSEIQGLTGLSRLDLSQTDPTAGGTTFLTGEIPSTLGVLTNLQEINLSINSLGFFFPPGSDPVPVPGAIPTTLSNLVNLRTFQISNNFFFEAVNFDTYIPISTLETLDISRNIFTGQIPDTVGDFGDSLTLLHMGDNLYTGTMPTTFGNLASLTSLSVVLSDSSEETDGSCEGVEGGCLVGPIPSELGNLNNLEELFLSENSLSGFIPSEIGLCTSLTLLSLFKNAVSGTIPSEFASLTSLQTLNLAVNFLGDQLTQAIFELPALAILDLSINIFNNTGLPESYDLPSILSLRLDDNFISGTVPSQLSQIPSLENLNLYLNELSGQLPSELSMLPSLISLDLGENFFTGTIPTEYGSFQFLVALTLDLNVMTGSIPTELGDLAVLNDLRLSANRLTGPIPSEMGRFSFMTNLELTNNLLTGTIPTDFGNVVTLVDLELDINELTGTIPTELSQLTSLQVLRLESNNLTGAAPDGVCDLQLQDFVTDCVGDSPEVECSCCSSCPDPVDGQLRASDLFSFTTLSTAADLTPATTFTESTDQYDYSYDYLLPTGHP